MKRITHPIAVLVATLAIISCNKQKAAINDSENATLEAIDNRKAEVEASAKRATELTETNAEIDKARIEADKISEQAQLDADKKKAAAEADAAKAKVDAENR